MPHYWLLEATISFDIATFFLPVRAISKCALSPWGPCTYKARFMSVYLKVHMGDVHNISKCALFHNLVNNFKI